MEKNRISDDELLRREANFHEGFTKVFTDVGVTWVAKTHYTLSS